MRRACSLLLAAVLLAGAVGLVHADLKDYVFIVKPVYYEKTRALFLQLANYFGDQGNPDAQQYFTVMAGEYAHGSGWLMVDADGQDYLITNRHVVIGAGTVNVYQERQDGTQTAWTECPIVYVDSQMDLAVCQFPGGKNPFTTGFRLDTRVEKDLTDVVAAGFPGFGGKPLWQVSTGTITNSQARIDPAYSYLIQHSAPIDPGNSGGPLLVRDPSAPTGFSVVGVNTLKAVKRESTNFAIPARHVAEVLDKARRAKRLATNPQGLRNDLIKSCTMLTAELNRDNPVDQEVNQHISYAIVGEEGWKAYTTVLKAVRDQRQFVEWFLEDPVEAMRTSIFWLFSAEVHREAGTVVQFKGINPADLDKIGSQGAIRTTFLIGDRPKEIVWSLEYGQWRISDMSLDLAPGPSPASTPSGGGSPQGSAAAHFPVHSVLGALGLAGDGLYAGFEYTGMILPGPIGLSAALGVAMDGSVFLVGGAAWAPFVDLLVPLRIGIAATPLGTSLIISPGVLLKLGDLAFGLDLGYVIPDSALFGIGVGINF